MVNLILSVLKYDRKWQRFMSYPKNEAWSPCMNAKISN